MQAARLLLALAQAGETGAFLWLGDSSESSGPARRARISLVHGWVHALQTDDDPKNERSSRTAERLERLLAQTGAAHFEPDASPNRGGRCTPFHPGRAIRRALGSLGMDGAPAWSSDDSVVVTLLFVPHPSCFEEPERPAMARLSRSATIADLTPYLSRQLLIRLLDFLRLCGAWQPSAPSPYVLLGVAPGSSTRELRAAFLQLARALHPDAHPQASAAERQALGDQFGAVAAAYRSLIK